MSQDFSAMPILDVAALNTPEALDYVWAHPAFQPDVYYGGGRVGLFDAAINAMRWWAVDSNTRPALNALVHWQGAALCDIGCGPGRMWQRFMRAYPEYHGILAGLDFAPSAIERARTAVPDADWRVGDVRKAPWADDTFDVVFCIEALEHMTYYREALAEMARIARPGGLLVLTVPNIEPGQKDGTKAHVNFWHRDSFAALLSEYGPAEVRKLGASNLLGTVRLAE